MSEQPYTPTTDEVRGAYQEWNQDVGGAPYLPEKSGAEFDRWLAKVKADAWDACVSQAEACGYIGLNDASELESIFNPYRQEATR